LRASLKKGNIWNYRTAVIYCEEESVLHGWLSTSTDKESSIKADRQQNAERNRREGKRYNYRGARIEKTRIV